MFTIVNGVSCFYAHSKTLSYIVAKLEDQSLDTLMALGRGQMYNLSSIQALKYKLANGVLVTLRTD